MKIITLIFFNVLVLFSNNTYTQTKPATLDLTTSSSIVVLKLRANTWCIIFGPVIIDENI